MNRCLHAGVWGCLLLSGLLLAGAWYLWDSQPPAEAWTIDRSEQVLSGVAADDNVKVSFHLTNTARRPLRILGGRAC
jgi:hypothetical protein